MIAAIFLIVPHIMGLHISSNSFTSAHQNLEVPEDAHLSPCLQQAVTEVKEAMAIGKVTLQGTCHAYSLVNSPPQDSKASPLNLLRCKHFDLDVNKRTVTVEPGVRYVDVIPALRKAGFFLTHGNYGGQTIIGLLSTGTHGAGTHSPHNYIQEMIVINGLGIIKRITPFSPDFSAWQNGIGVLGTVLQVTVGLLPEYKIRGNNFLETSVVDSIERMKNAIYAGKIFTFVLCFNITSSGSTCVITEREITQEPLSAPHDQTDGLGCCGDWSTPGASFVASSVDGDLYTGADQEPKEVSNDICLNMTAHKLINSAAGVKDLKALWKIEDTSIEIEIGQWDLPKLTLLINEFYDRLGQNQSDSKANFHMRYVPKDILPPLLSFARYDNMWTVELSLAGYSSTSDEERIKFYNALDWIQTGLRALGANLRLHLGKGALGNHKHFAAGATGENLPTVALADMSQFNFWKQINDPQNIFTNQKWETFQKYYLLS